MMDYRSHGVTAYRVVLELPADSDRAFSTAPARRAADRLVAAAGAAREALASAWQRLTARPDEKPAEPLVSEEDVRPVDGVASNGEAPRAGDRAPDAARGRSSSATHTTVAK